MGKHVFPALLTLLVGAAVGAEERIACEDFSSPDTLTFGPENVTTGRLKSSVSARYPFDGYLALPAGSEVCSGGLQLGATGAGRLEDVVWMRLLSSEESDPGRREAFTVVGFDRGGPEVRLRRTSSRPEATLEWFDGNNWNATGAVIALDRDYRLRTVMDLDLGTMDLFVRPEGVAERRELSLALGVTFRAFPKGTVRRLFRLGRPAEVAVQLAGWQLWRVGTSELVRVSSPAPSEGPPVTVMRYAAPVVLEGDAIRQAGAGGDLACTLQAVRGLRDDMELPDISRWTPSARVQRQTSFRLSGKWSLGISEGFQPVDTELTLPRGDFELKMYFLVPKELPPNRQVYLVRFKNADTEAEPVGPSVYLDYGAAPAGGSLVICQLRSDTYHSEPVEVKPGEWYGLRLVSERARSAYNLWFVDGEGKEQAVNGGKPLSFFLGTSMGDEVLLRFFSIVSMRPAVTDWPKIDVSVKRRRVDVTVPDGVKQQLTGLVLRGLRADKAGDLDWSDLGKVSYAVSRYGEVLDKDWPNLRITKADAGKLKDYKALLISGNVYLPWGEVEFSGNTSGAVLLSAPNVAQYAPMSSTAPGEFRPFTRAEERPRGLPSGTVPVQMTFLPGSNTADMRAEVRWINPAGKVENSQPVPPELIHGGKVRLDHPGPSLPVDGAAALDDKLYVACGSVGLEVYDRDLVCTGYDPRKFERAISNYAYVITAFTWDPWSGRFYLHSGGTRRTAVVDRDFNPTAPVGQFTLDSVGVAAGPDEFYFIVRDGTVVRSDKFLATRGTLPVEKMFGGSPLFSAAACVDGYLFLATRRDSPLLPSQVICIDVANWNPIFSVDLKDKYPTVTSMACDGETMYLFDRDRADVAMFRLPPRHELDPQKTFVYVDDLELTERKGAQDIQFIPDPSGGVSGWMPNGSLVANEKGQGWVVRDGYMPAYEKANIAYIGTEKSQKGYLKLRTLDPAGNSLLYVDVRTADNPVVRSVLLLFLGETPHIKENLALWGKTYTLTGFFAEKRFGTWWDLFPWWRQCLEGPVGGRDLRRIRMLAVGQNTQDHVFSLEEDFGIQPGETISGVRLVQVWGPVPMLSLSLSLSELMPREERSGTVTSYPALLDDACHRLEWVSWDAVPFDAACGSLVIRVRTADEKYFMDREPWVPVEDPGKIRMPLGRYLEWRVQMSTRDPWRPPGMSGLVFGLGKTEAASGPETETGGSRWLWLLLLVPAAAAVAWFLIGRKSWWQRNHRASKA